jgi:hypothetical protein
MREYTSGDFKTIRQYGNGSFKYLYLVNNCLKYVATAGVRSVSQKEKKA